MGEDGQIPAGAQGMAIFVIVYTFINAFASTVVFSMHVYHGDVFGYVPICAVFMLISIAASFIQQIHHYVNYTSIITASFKWRHGNDRTGKEAFTGTYTEMDTVLYEIQLYCYNVESLLFLLWVAGLCRHVWRVRIGIMDQNEVMIATTSKILAVALPAILIGLANTASVERSPAISLILANILLASSVAIGLIFLALVFSKYVSIRRRLGSSGTTSGIFARIKWRLKFAAPDSQQSNTQHSQLCRGQMQSSTNRQGSHSYGQTSAPHTLSTAGYDKWLVLRFGICFVILCVMQVFSIYYSVAQYFSSKATATDTAIDLSDSTATIGLCLFMPGVTTGLLIFIVFGTTKAFRADYARWLSVLPLCGKQRRMPGEELRRTESIIHLTNVSYNDERCTSSANPETVSIVSGAPSHAKLSADVHVTECGKEEKEHKVKEDDSIYVSENFGAR